MRRCTFRIVCLLGIVGLLFADVLHIGLPAAEADDWPRFRGPRNDGKSAEKGLLARWPSGGPQKLWTIEGLGSGYSGPAIVGDRIFVTGMEDGQGVLRCLKVADGEELWKATYGPEWTGSYPGARTTPAVHDGKVYLMSGQGVASCWNAEDGKPVWSVDTVQVYGARNIQWGISESPLVDGKGVIVTPGGTKACVVKLDLKTGKRLWATTGLKDKSAYCSVGIVGASKSGKGGVLVTMTENVIVALDRRSGRVLWKVRNRNQYAVHANTPLMTRSGILVCSSGYGLGSVGLRLGRGARSQSQAWKQKVMDNHFGGNVVVGDYVFGTSTNRPKARLLCLDGRRGTIAAESRVIGKGQIIYAEGNIYAYGENGVCALVKADPRNMATLGQFNVTHGGGEHWAHPAIADGVLYIRHGQAMAAYKIKK